MIMCDPGRWRAGLALYRGGGGEGVPQILKKQAPVGTGMSRWGMLLQVNEAGMYGGQNKIGVHVYHVGIAIYT